MWRWIGRLLSESNDAWKAIPNAYFNRYGGLPFLKNTGKYLSFEEFKTKFNYCQILSTISKTLKLKAMTIKKPLETITEETDVYQLANGKTICLSEMRCKDYYSLFQVKWETQPTSVQSWSKHYPPFANKWNNLFKNISKMSADNKLRQFSFKLLHRILVTIHRILVTKKELKRYKIKLDDECFFLQKSRFSRTLISGLLCRQGLLLRNDDMVQQRTEIPL